MLGQFRTYAGHQLRFSKTTVNDQQFMGARMRTYFCHVCGINHIQAITQALPEVTTSQAMWLARA